MNNKDEDFESFSDDIIGQVCSVFGIEPEMVRREYSRWINEMPAECIEQMRRFGIDINKQTTREKLS